MRSIFFLAIVQILSACASTDHYLINEKLSHIKGVSVIKKDNADTVIFFDSIFFDFDSYELDESGLATCLTVGEVLQVKLKKRYLYIEGHTDSTGSEEVNLRLSTNRANKIKECIYQGGYDPDRIDIIGYGETMPLCDNKTAKGRACNRRVEIVVVRYKRSS